MSALGDIGVVKIVSEGSIGSNVRRIEAVTGASVVELLRERDDSMSDIAQTLGVPVEDLTEGLRKRLAELKDLRGEVADLRRALAGTQSDDLAAAAVDGLIVARVEAERREDVRDLAVALRDKPGMRAVVLGASPGGKGVALVAAVTPDSGLNASELIADAARKVGGGGGKGPELAMAGGKSPESLDEALDGVRAQLGL